MDKCLRKHNKSISRRNRKWNSSTTTKKWSVAKILPIKKASDRLLYGIFYQTLKEQVNQILQNEYTKRKSGNALQHIFWSSHNPDSKT